MRFNIFGGLLPFKPRQALNDAAAGVTLASMNIPQVLGYTRIAGTPVVTGLYTILLPIIAFAIFGSSRHLVVSADSATAAIFGISAANAAAALSGAFVVNGSPTQTAMASDAGARSQIAQLAFAAVALIVILLLTGPLQYLPHCVLASIVFTIAVGMVDVTTFSDIQRKSPSEFFVALFTAAAVPVIGVEQGLLLAIALSLVQHVRHSYQPHTVILMPGTTKRWARAQATPGSQTEPGLIVYRFGADLFYANADHFADEVRALVEKAPIRVRWFVLDADALTDIDYTAALTVRDLLGELASKNVRVAFARVSAFLRADLDRLGVGQMLGELLIFETLHDAITASGADRASTDPMSANTPAPTYHQP